MSQIPSLENWLKGGPKTFKLLNLSKAETTLTKSQRSQIVRAVIDREHVAQTKYLNLRSGRYVELANEICALFTNEITSTYYVPHQSLGPGLAVNAHSALLWRNDLLRKNQARADKELDDVNGNYNI